MSRSTVLERVRTEQVVRRIERGRFGLTTHNFTRTERIQRVAFRVFLGTSALVGVAVALA